MEKISTVLQIVFWVALGAFFYVLLITSAFTYSILPLYQAIVYWLEFGIWQVETFESSGIISNSTWVGLNKVLSFFGSFATWWPILIVHLFVAPIINGFTFQQALDRYRLLKQNDEDLYDDYN